MIGSDVKLRILCPLAAILLVSWSSPANADMVYGVSGVGGAASVLYMESYTNGVGQPSGAAFTTVGSVTLTTTNGPALSLSGIAYVKGTLYGVTNSMGGTVNGNGPYENTLVTINPTSGVASLVNGNLGTGAAVQSLAYDPSPLNANLYGFSKSGVGPSPVANSLVLITTGPGGGVASQVGSGTSIPATPSTAGNGLAFDASGNGYLSAFTITAPTNGTMYSVTADGPAAGTATNSGLGFTNVPLPSSNLKALAFDSSGNFYGLNFQPNTTTDLVELANTGSSWSLTNLNTTTPNGGPSVPFVGIAFAPAAVPEPGSLALVAIGAVGLAFRSWTFKQRQAKALSEGLPG